MQSASLSNRIERKLHDAQSAIAHALGFQNEAAQPAAHTREIQKYPPQEDLTVGSSLEVELFGDASTASKFSYPDACLSEIEDCFIVGDRGYVYTRDKTLLGLCPDDFAARSSKIRRPIPALARQIDEPLLHFTGKDHESHGHFMLQYLPRLLLALPFLQEHPEIKILTAPDHSKWQARYLSHFGIPKERLIEGSYGTIRASKLYYQSFLHGQNPFPNDVLLTQVADHLRGTPDTEPSKNRILFLSRDDAPDRRITNETDLIEETRKAFGEVELIRLAEFSMADQIEMFRSAKVVLGGYGQGLTNIMYSRGATAVVIDPSDRLKRGHWPRAFRDLAEMTGNRGVRFITGVEAPDSTCNYEFPIERYRNLISRLRDALG